MTNFNEDILKYLDKNYHVCQADGDGGDSTHRIGSISACSTNKELVDLMTKALIINEEYSGVGRFCRNPSPGRWYSNPNNTTRDQMQAVEAGWIVTNNVEQARRHFKQRLKRFMFHFSHENDGYDSGLPLIKKFPDITGPVESTLIIRGAQFSITRPLLYLLDIAYVLELLIFRRFAPLRDWDWDASFLPMLVAAKKRWPTFWIKIAIKMYAKLPVIERLRHYYSEKNGLNGIEPLGELLVDCYEREILNK